MRPLRSVIVEVAGHTSQPTPPSPPTPKPFSTPYHGVTNVARLRPEVKRLGKTLRRWPNEILAYCTTGGVSNGGTETINGVIEKARRLAHGLHNFTNYRIGILLAAEGSRPYRRRPAIRPEPCCWGRAIKAAIILDPEVLAKVSEARDLPCPSLDDTAAQ